MKLFTILALGASITYGRQFLSEEIAKVVMGVNELGPEYNPGILPGVPGKDFTWYNTSTFENLRKRGISFFRLHFLMERLVPEDMLGAFDLAYMDELKKAVKAATYHGSAVILTPHNFGRYNGKVITRPKEFKQFWKNVASEFRYSPRVVFDVMHQFHDMHQDLVIKLNQAAVDGIRSAGCAEHYILLSGNGRSNAWTWTFERDPNTGKTNSQTMMAVKDKRHRTLILLNIWLDSEGTGAGSKCHSFEVVKNRLDKVTAWLQDHNKQVIIGEIAAGSDEDCIIALQNGLRFISLQHEIYKATLWSTAGPWTHGDQYSMEPSNGTSYTEILPRLMDYTESRDFGGSFILKGE